MVCNRRMAYKYNSYIIKKIPYTKMLIKIKIVELSKQPLFMVCRGKEIN